MKFREALFESASLTVFIAAISVLIAQVSVRAVSPVWLAPGWPSYNGYPKNVELAAMGFILAVVPFAAWVFQRLKRPSVKVSVAGLALVTALMPIYRNIKMDEIHLWVFSLSGMFFLLSALYYALFNRAFEGEPPKANPHILAFAGIAGFFYLFLVMFYESYNAPLDVHHMGERFTSAVDFLGGGRPFVTYFWPHGLQDTGLIALVFRLTSRADLPTMALGDSLIGSLGLITVLMMAYGMGLGYYSILLSAVLLLLNDSWYYSYISGLWPVALSFLVFSKARRRHHFVLAGIVAFAAHLYRIDHGVYGLLSIAALGSFQTAAALLRKDFAGSREKAANLAFFLSGIAMAALAMYLIFGWPGHEWYRIAFVVLPKYHADSTGFPYPLPLKWRAGQGDLARTASIYLMTALGVAAIASKYLIKSLRDAGLKGFPVLLVIFSVLSLRSAFGRSDEGHITAVSSVMYVVLALFVAKAIISLKKPGWVKAVSIAVFFTLFNFNTGELFRSPSVNSLGASKEAIGILEEHDDAPPAQCSWLFSKRQLNDPSNRDFERRVCVVKGLLQAMDIGEKQLLVVNSASLLYPALGYRLPTKYYCLGWAITPDMQKDLIAELERADVKAILIAKGFGALTVYDIPDSARLPVYFRWVNERFETSKALDTPLGVLIMSKDLWRESTGGL